MLETSLEIETPSERVFRLAASVPASMWTELTSELISVDPLCGNKERVLDGEG